MFRRRLARLERAVERLVTVIETLSLTSLPGLVDTLDAENRRLRTELAQHAKGKR